MDKDYMLPYEYSRVMEHRKWFKEIPYLQFPSDWKVQVSPPFSGAVVRFQVKKAKAHVSVYLDCYCNLGIWDGPYWEVYPYGGDIYRCGMNEVDKLLEAITKSIKEQNK